MEWPGRATPVARLWYGTQMKEHRGWHSRNYLPHLDSPDLVQTVTFRLADSLPEGVRQAFASDPDRELKREAALDAGYGACWLREPTIAALVEDGMLHFDGIRYRLIAWCVMPNHVHAMFEPKQGYRLGDIVGSWKRFTARAANRELSREGTFWQSEYYDRYVRNDAHFAAAIEYIEQNPVAAGLVVRAVDWRWSSARRRA